MGSRGQSLAIDLRNNQDKFKGQVIIKAEPMAESNDYFQVQFFATRKLAKKDGFFGRSDPFICANRLREDGTHQRVWQSEVVMNDLTPTWKPARIGIQPLCNSDLDRPLRFEVYDWDDDGTNDYMGSFETSLRGLIDDPTRERPLIEEAKKKKRNYHDSGGVACRFAQMIHETTFLDFIRGGCELNLMVAIDFTGSNGDPSSPSSLHFIDPSGVHLNEYQHAILSVGSIVQDYDYDRMFPVYGFGGRVGGQISHCFPVYPEGTEVLGVEGIMEAYSVCMNNITLAGPTLFAPILAAALQKAADPVCTQDSQRYQVLLIICDGIINDMEATIDQIVAASSLPLSIIIVGVGSADFSDMDRLDADEGFLMSSNGTHAQRDIVQFVPFREYAGNPTALAAEVLKEIPGQITDYMKMHGLSPNDPIPPQNIPDPYQPTSSEEKVQDDLPPSYTG